MTENVIALILFYEDFSCCESTSKAQSFPIIFYFNLSHFRVSTATIDFDRYCKCRLEFFGSYFPVVVLNVVWRGS